MKINRSQKTEVPATVRPAGKSGAFRFRHLIYAVLVVLFALAVFSRDSSDDVLVKNSRDLSVLVLHNYLGVAGEFIAGSLLLAIGLAGYVLAVFLLLWVIRIIFFRDERNGKYYWAVLMLLVVGTMLLCAYKPSVFPSELLEKRIQPVARTSNPDEAWSGGLIGQYLIGPTYRSAKGVHVGVLRIFGDVGSLALAIGMAATGLIMIYLIDWHAVIRRKYLCGATAKSESEAEASGLFSKLKSAASLLKNRPKPEPERSEAPKAPAPPPSLPPPPATPARRSAGTLTPDLPLLNTNSADPHTKITVKGGDGKIGRTFTLPSQEMLGKGAEAGGESPETIELMKAKLQYTLDSFGVNGHVSGHVSGPRLTRYEIQLAPDVMVDKVTRLENNIAMQMEARSIRILAPIPGRNAVGIEAPNQKSESIFMRQVMETDAWAAAKAEIPIVLGKNVSGKPIVLDLAKAPHLLIAGSTGSGKSVCMNTLIMSLLFKFKPDELKLIMVDPKVVEFADYQKLPHLITPVINDSKKVPVALRWAVNEMERRYQLLAKVGVKKLSEFNHRPADRAFADDDGNPIPDKLPILVVIIDELADLMLTEARAESETAISRIAAKGRAAGVHIVVATQRPDRTIITGVIKANLPTRIAFRVGSGVDSSVILDQRGAEKLLGQGDMLFLPPGSAELERIQGAFVPDGDIKKIVRFISEQAPQEFNDSVTAAPEELAEGEYGTMDSAADDDDLTDNVGAMVRKYLRPGDDPKMRRALEIIFSSRQASISYLQRRMSIGYNTAANLIDQLEERGVIGPQVAGGNKREILVFDDILNDTNQ